MFATHQIVTTVLLSLHRQIYHCTEEKIDNVLTHCKIAALVQNHKLFHWVYIHP